MRAALPFYLLALLPFLTGCSDFLDKEIEGYATDETFYNTQREIQEALNATYDILQSDSYNDQEWRFGEATADNVIGGDEGLSSQMGQLVQFEFDTSNTWILQRWQVNFRGVHRANQVIANMDRVKITTTNYNTYLAVRQIYGQAKFLRAFFYFNLVKTFGGVPIRPETETVEGLVIPRNTLEECYAYIEKDLREAALMLPVTYDGNNFGKATKGAAVALLMKVLMYQAKPRVASEKWQQMKEIGDYFVGGQTMTYGDMVQFQGGSDQWEALRKRLWFKPLAEAAEGDPYENYDTPLDALSSVYSLEYRDYYGNLLHNGDRYSYIYQWYKEGEMCRGSVFEVVFKESADGTSGDTNEGAGIYLFNSNQMWATSDLLKKIFDGDVRSEKEFIIHHQQNTPDGIIWQNIEGHYVTLKWYIPQKDYPKYDGDNQCNRRVIRYPEVVLMYAEALNECGDRQGALTQLNKCKAQVNTINNSTQLYVAGDYAKLRDQIWQERRMELAFEWDRFFDIVRQGRAAEVLHTFGATRPNNRGRFFTKGVNEVFPIPQNTIDLSNGIVEQNPGY